jgi:glycopeptide antibiotics resistance protein
MSVFELINLGAEYLKLGMAAVVFIVVCILVGYYGIYRTVFKGEKKLPWKKLLWWGIFICYLAVVLGATLLSREEILSNEKIHPLFYSYRKAWVYFSETEWRNIVLNFCMFVPLGIWLPLGIRWFRSVHRTYLAGFIFSVSIELLQRCLHRGIFDLDDVMGNTVGAMIGYGIFVLMQMVVTRIRKDKKGKILPVLALQIPLAATTAMFVIIFAAYQLQELGNNPYGYIRAYDANLLHVSAEREFDTEEKELAVYEGAVLTVKEAKEKGEQIFERMGTGIDESGTDIYDETLVLRSASGDMSLWIDYQGGTYSLTCFDILFPENGAESEPVKGATEKLIRNALGTMGFEVPEGAVFSEGDNGNYRFKVSMQKTDTGIVDGTFSCTYYGENKIGTITNKLMTCQAYKMYPAISEQEAFEKIARGEFSYYGNEELDIQVESGSIAYCMDSKGYYQPVWQFACVINGESGELAVPALE